MFTRTELTDLMRLSESFQAFGWEDWRQTGDGKWASASGKRVLSDAVFQRLRGNRRPRPDAETGAAAVAPQLVPAQARPQAQAATPQATPSRRNLLTRAAHAVGRAATSADRVAGRKVGAVAGRVIDWKKRQAARVQTAMAEGKLGKALAWAAGTDVGRRTVQELERRAQRVEQTVKEMGTEGFVTAKARGVGRVLRYVYSKFLANRRKYGLLPAVAIEAAVIGLTQVLPRAAMAAGGLAAAAVGSAGGPGGAVAAGLGGWAASNTLLTWAGRKLFGKLAPTLVRAAAESAAGWIAHRVRGPSGVRVRRAEQTRAALVPVPDVLPPVPRVTFAEGGAPTLDDVAGEIGRRLREMGAEVPPAEELMRAVGAVLEAMMVG